MAAGTKLEITFLDAASIERKFSFSYAAPTPAASQVKAAAQAIVTNGSIFKNVPVSAKAVKLVTTTEQEVDISE